MKVNNGEDTSFWYDVWSPLGCLIDITGAHGIIQLGIPEDATLASVWRSHRRRNHRREVLNCIEEAIAEAHRGQNDNADQSLWKLRNGTFGPVFSSKSTWHNIRHHLPRQSWTSVIWFSNATPKYAFLSWLAMKDRLSTGDRLRLWNPGIWTGCTLCSEPMETKVHLFFECSFTHQIWRNLTERLLNDKYTNRWNEIVALLSTNRLDGTTLFLVRYAFQATLHLVWRERNSRRHGEVPKPAQSLIATLDKALRNRLSSMRMAGDLRFSDGLQIWFGSRS
ncbi:uncharacterized protein LOC112086531 [Eutrema salsugineum]|uniref:uncharacterized protein LOC112086531 n=1 Tax=Eutrema salsugineum TaxID=72664 RepID=UPI000CED15CA|nr:uncharacterized protein LOC112086531 [Eutrema salsugineum]